MASWTVGEGMALKHVEAKSRGTGDSKPPQPLSEEERKSIAKIVYHELRQATEPMTMARLCEQTLLPVHEVRQAIDALTDRGLCRARPPRTDHQPTTYLAYRPSEGRV